MTNLKKIIAGVMVAGMLATTGVSAFATDVQRRSRPCDNCGAGTVTATVYRGPWQYAGRVECVHEGGEGQLDERYTRVVTTTYSCTNCSYSPSYDSVEEDFRHLG